MAGHSSRANDRPATDRGIGANSARGGFKIRVIAVGRLRAGPEQTLFRHYAERVAWPVSVVEIEQSRETSPALRRRREGESLIAAIPKDATVVALDEKGKSLTSREFADKLAVWRDRGAGMLAVLVGGADGLDPSVRERADLTLALGMMTWPHFLVRALLAEQLYRAQMILSGHPYHRD